MARCWDMTTQNWNMQKLLSSHFWDAEEGGKEQHCAYTEYGWPNNVPSLRSGRAYASHMELPKDQQWNSQFCSADGIKSQACHIKQVAKALQDMVTAIGEDVLNIKAEEVGTHSLWSAAAMAMFFGGPPVYLIMLMGRWSSDAFLQYICKQIEQFSHDVSSKIIENMFHQYIPSLSTTNTDRDPRQCNNPNNTKTWRNVGGNANCQARLPAF